MNIAERIQRGRVAINQAKARGQNVKEWEEHLARLERQARFALIHWPETIKGVVENTTIKGVRICSHVLEDEIWLILDSSFIPHDGLACYYVEEIPLLKNKSVMDLKLIHETKLKFPCCRVIQEGAD